MDKDNISLPAARFSRLPPEVSVCLSSTGSGVFFFAVAPPGLCRPDVVPQTFFVIV